MTPTSEIKVLSSLATRGAHLELVPVFEGASGQTASTTWAGTVDIMKRITSGEDFDLVIGSKNTINELIKLARIEPHSLVDLASTGIGVAVRGGARHPDIGSAEALKQMLLTAKSVGYSTGPSGVYLVSLFDRMGIAAEVAAKARQVPPGKTVGPIVASGEVEVGFQQLSELLSVEGIEVVGPLPAEVQHVTVISCGVPVRAKNPDAARLLTRFLSTPMAGDAMERAGLQRA